MEPGQNPGQACPGYCEAKAEADSPAAAATPSHYVGIGASAGGLEAIETFFKHMTPRSGLAFIVVQHLSPDYKSLMVELLSKRTEMPVHRAEDGMTVAADNVYLIPPKRNLTIFHGRLLLSDQDPARGINLPIDIFLRSLAEDQGDKAIGIVLSGTGSDGMRGVRAIKEKGGMVMVQTADSAKFDGMPRAAASTGLADFVLDPDQMPKQLLAFVQHPRVSQQERSDHLLKDEDGLTRVFAILRDRCKVDFTYYKPSTVMRRIDRRMTVNQMEDIREYAGYLSRHPGEALTLYRELLIGVTNFFRDPKVFEDLGDRWLPEILGDGSRRDIRLWVAGCSTGEEAYSLAILARETMQRLEVSHDIKIFATDIDRDAIVYAQNGAYPESIAADLDPRLLAKYFYKREDNFQIARSIREMVVFAQHNLIKDPPFTNIRLISCRNLLIYLQPVLQRKVLEHFNFSLVSGGVLLLGTSETVGDHTDCFEPLNAKHKIYRSRGRLHQPGNERLPLEAGSYFREQRAALPGLRAAGRPHDEERIIDRFLDALIGDYVPLALVVNGQLEVLRVLGDTGGLFKLPSGRIVNDITKMAVRELAIPLATGIQKVIRTGEAMSYANIRLPADGDERLLKMRIKPMTATKGQEPLVAVFLQDMPAAAGARPAEDATAFDMSKITEQHIRDLEQDLQFTRENLQATIEELETANEELQATNEELLASNEELQSTNEELQSANEELHTVNAEHQSKIIELTELNNDVENLLASTQIGKLMLDENLEVRRFSPHIATIFNILETDIGRPVTHVSHRLVDADPVAVLREVVQREKPVEKEVRTEDGRCYLMRVMPYLIGPQTFSGAVMSFVDISPVKAAQQALAKSETTLRETARLAAVGSWSFDLQRQALRWSEEIYRIHELDPGTLVTARLALSFYTPESRPAIKAAFQQACETGAPYDLVLEIVTSKDNRRWVRTIGRTATENGSVQHVYGAFQDITAVKRIESALHQSREDFRLLFETMGQGVVYQDAEGRIIAANPAAERILGLPLDQMQGLTSQDPRWRAVHLDGTEFEDHEHPAMVALKTGRPVHQAVMGVFNPQSEQMRWIHVNATPLFSHGRDRPDRVYTTFDDITALIRPKAALNEKHPEGRTDE